MLIESQEWMFYAGRAVLLSVAMLAFALALLRWRRAGVRDTQRILGELDESRQHAQALAGLARELVHKLDALEVRMDEGLALAAGAGNQQRGYDLALQMARNGAGAEDIASASGVTQHEASFLARMHNPQQA